VTIFLTVVHVLVCLILIVVVLLQRGKGAEIGAVFGGGGSSTVFGSRGAGNFFTKLTAGAAIIFMGTSLILSYMGTGDSGSTLFPEGEDDPAAAEEAAPEADAADSPFVEVPQVAPAAEETPASPEATPEAPGNP
jgi:preprotein translocase subunit SecG